VVAVQLLFSCGMGFRIETLRAQVSEALRQCGDGQMREAGDLSMAEVMEALVEANDYLQRYGLQIQIQAGHVRMATLQVHAKSVRSLLDSYAGEQNQTGETELTNTGLLVLSIIAYKQPIPLSEISSLLGSDARYQVNRLRSMGLVDSIRVEGEVGHRFVTTAVFAERFGINSPADLPPVE
jgi:chromosome segregation and condensation protein ScpB